MLFKDCIKQYKSNIYISLYNTKDQRFYGNFADSDLLKDYYNYEVEYDRPHGNFIRLIKLVGYEYPLGLDSMRVYWEKEEKQKSSRRR